MKTHHLCSFRIALLSIGLLLIASNVSAPALGQPHHTANYRSNRAPLTVMAWNIWHGGREDGDTQGPLRVAEVIRSSGADIVALQETYGSGEIIAKDLGFHFHPRGTNVSILSRYPIIEDLSVHKEFNCVGALVKPPFGEPVAFFSIW